MKMNHKFCYLFCFLINLLYADISTDLMKFFKNAGMANNVTAGGAYKDQSAGYYTGGSLTTRTGVRNAQLASVQMPGFRGGCGGIDLWGGGFSHISSEQLVAMLKNIGSSAASYAFMLAIQSVSPQIYNIMNELNALATQINQTNINSCEAAATMLGGIWPKTDQSSKHLCQSMGNQMGHFSDWAQARQGCGAKGNREGVLNHASSDPKYKDMLVGEFNLAWKAIQKNDFLIGDRQLAQLFLTLVGSIVSRKNGENYEIATLPSHVDRDDVLKGLLEGGEADIYVCNDERCLYPSLHKVHINQNSSLIRKTHTLLESLVNKIYDEGVLTEEEKAFLNSTRLPVYKMLNVMTAYRRGECPLDIHHYAELIAFDILYKYILEVIDIVHDSVADLKSVQVDAAHMDRFLKQLQHARERVLQKRQAAYQQMDSTLSFIQATQSIEKQLYMMIGQSVDEGSFIE